MTLSIKQRLRLAPPSNLGVSRKHKQHRYNTTAPSQRTSILHWFGEINQRLSTIDAREALGIMSPASRILELRRTGHKIILNWEKQQDSSGTTHKVGVYVYLGFRQSEVSHV